MKVTVCELDDDPEVLERDWVSLVAHVRSEGSRLVLLPEMPFASWFPRRRPFEAEVWRRALEVHDRWLSRLPELAPAAVLGSRPVEQGRLRLNEGFIWDEQAGYCPAHTKYYLPDEEGFWEASWYNRGTGAFTPAALGKARIGFAICTDLWFMERARAYGQQGIHILANPRGTLQSTQGKWLAGGRAAAVVSGAYTLSSNRVCSTDLEPAFGGQGWVIGPDGDVLGLTSTGQPFLSVEIDLKEAERAKRTYPRYVAE